VASLPQHRYSLSATATANGMVYAIAGEACTLYTSYQYCNPTDQVEAFSTALGQWWR
jgi:hypothetical protein